MTRPASDRCAHVFASGGTCGVWRDTHEHVPFKAEYAHAFVAPPVTSTQGARVVSWKVELEPEGPPVTSTKETGEAKVREIAARIALDYGVPLDHAVGILKLGIAAGRAKAFEEADEVVAHEESIGTGTAEFIATRIRHAIAARAKEPK